MGLSLLNVISKSNFRIYKPNFLCNYLGRHKEIQCIRFFSYNLQKKPIDTYKKVINLFINIIKLNIKFHTKKIII